MPINAVEEPVPVIDIPYLSYPNRLLYNNIVERYLNRVTIPELSPDLQTWLRNSEVATPFLYTIVAGDMVHIGASATPTAMLQVTGGTLAASTGLLKMTATYPAGVNAVAITLTAASGVVADGANIQLTPSATSHGISVVGLVLAAGYTGNTGTTGLKISNLTSAGAGANYGIDVTVPNQQNAGVAVAIRGNAQAIAGGGAIGAYLTTQGQTPPTSWRSCLVLDQGAATGDDHITCLSAGTGFLQIRPRSPYMILRALTDGSIFEGVNVAGSTVISMTTSAPVGFAATGTRAEYKWRGTVVNSFARVSAASDQDDWQASVNAAYNGTSWNRDNTTRDSALIQFVGSTATNFLFRMFFSAAAANPITWTQTFTISRTGVVTLWDNLAFQTDNANDIGAAAASRPRTGYFGTSVVTPALTLSGLTAGSVLFAGAGGAISQDNANLSWDNTNKILKSNILRVGTLVDPVNQGDCGGGLVGANRWYWDRLNAVHNTYGTDPEIRLISTVVGGRTYRLISFSDGTVSLRDNATGYDFLRSDTAQRLGFGTAPGAGAKFHFFDSSTTGACLLVQENNIASNIAEFGNAAGSRVIILNTGAVRCGSLTDPTAQGDFGAGLTGAARFFYLQASGRASWFSSAGTETLRLSTSEDSYINTGKNLGFNTTTQFGSGVGVVGIANATTVPTANPTGGGVLYSEAGAGKWRGSGGTITTFGPAEPHCPVCGTDYALEWENSRWGKLQICMNCFAREFASRPWVRRLQARAN